MRGSVKPHSSEVVMYAVIKTGGKQYRVIKGETLKVEIIAGEVGSAIVLDKVLMVGNGDKVSVGKPLLEGGIMIGNFLNAAIAFAILAVVVFFLIVKPYNTLMARFEKKPEPAPAGPAPATLDDVVAALRELRK